MIKSYCVGVARDHMSCSMGGAKDHKLLCGCG